MLPDPLHRLAWGAYLLYSSVPALSLSIFILSQVLHGAVFGKGRWFGAVPKDHDLRKKVADRQKRILGMMELRLFATSFCSRRMMDVEFILLALDLVLDLNCLAQFIVSGHFAFAVAQAAVVGLSLLHELVRGTPALLVQSIIQSRKLGYPTDTYLSIVRRSDVHERLSAIAVNGIRNFSTKHQVVLLDKNPTVDEPQEAKRPSKHHYRSSFSTIPLSMSTRRLWLS